MTDWSVIRQEYEQGSSLRDIVAAHGSSIATISRVARHEDWIRPVKVLEKLIETRTMKQMLKHETGIPPPSVSPMPLDAISVAREGLKQLALHLQGQTTEETLPIASHKLLSDALAQYVKVLVTAPREDAQDGLLLPLEKLLPSTRAEIRRLLAEDEQKQQEERAG